MTKAGTAAPPGNEGSTPSPASTCRCRAIFLQTHCLPDKPPRWRPGLYLETLFKQYPIMDTFNINVNVQVSLSQETLSVLRQFTPDMPEACNCTAADKDLKTFIKETVVEFLEGLKKDVKPEDNSGKDAKPAAQAPAEASPAPAPEKSSGTGEITDAALRQAVKEAKDRSGGSAVRALFGEFEIPNSSACPQERRSELMDRLGKL